jgi:asparagine synthase (glutamine-hydrolysing)
MATLAAAGQRGSWPWERLRRAATGVPVFWSGAEAFTELEKRRLLSRRLRERMKGRTSWDSLVGIHRRFRETAWDQSDLNWMIYSDLHLRLPELLLMRVDKMSMGASVEARVPFLDHRFVTFAMGLPQSVRLPGSELKHVLKRAVRGLIPDAIIDRRKQGFAVPIRDWVQDRLGAEMRETLRKFCAETEFFDWPAVDSLLARGRGPQAWYLFNFALWHRRFVAA